MVRSVDGRGFAFVPREVVAQPKAFGLASGLLEPAHEVDPESERYRAAMVQHLMVVAARDALLKAHGLSPTAFVERFDERGLGADRVRRIFRGESMAQLTDLMFWSGHFPEVAGAISSHISPVIETARPVLGVVDATREEPSEDAMLRERQLAALREQVEAQRGKPDAPAARRSPQHPFA